MKTLEGKTEREREKKRQKDLNERTIFPSWSEWSEWSECKTKHEYW